MARPIKQGLDYFPFDVDFFNDEKIVAIAGEYGIKGEITTIKLLCAVYRSGYFIEWNEMFKFKLLKELPGVSAELLDSIIQRLVKWDFFDKGLFDSASILTSKGIQRRYLTICSKMHRKNVISEYCLLPDESQPKPKAKPIAPIIPHITYPRISGPIPLEESISILLADSKWCEEVCNHYQLTPEELPQRINDFKQSCIRLGKIEHKDLADAKRHFCSWQTTSSKYKTNPSTPPHNPPDDYTFNGGFGGKDT